MDLNLKGRTAIVTGGSRGIGRAIAERFAAEGANVAICARSADEVAAAVRALEATGVRAMGRAVDVADRKAVTAWIDEAAQIFGGIDILVANVSALAGAPDEDSFRAGLEIDVLGTARAVDAALPYLQRSDAAAIVAIASTAALEAWGGVRAYNAIKAAVINYMSSLATALAEKGVRANTVSPGTIFFEGGVWDKRRREAPQTFETALRQNPMGRMGTPQEVADVVVFVASPRASFMTGDNIVVDGGLTRRVQY